MSAHAVIGMGFGDEGKGVVTEYLCSQDPENTVVVRFSGGHQCGHKVIKGDREHVFSNFGSGTLSGCSTYWSQYCTFEPVGFWKEYALLRVKGITPQITIHPDCPVTTIYDVFVNRTAEREAKHGTTGTGFFRTKHRHFKDNIKFTVKNCLFDSLDTILNKIDEIREYYKITKELNVGSFVEACLNIRNLIKHRCIQVSDQLPAYKNHVFEGSQGLLLDEHIGYFPHVTPSDVTPRNALNLSGGLDAVWLVSRAYQTRHGAGPITNVEHPVQLKNTERETNKFNEHQGYFRITTLDLDQLIFAKVAGIDKIVPNTKVNLVITCMDQVNPYDVSVGGKIISFTHAEEFVRFIGRKLNIDGDLYMNTSPASTTIRCVSSPHRVNFCAGVIVF